MLLCISSKDNTFMKCIIVYHFRMWKLDVGLVETVWYKKGCLCDLDLVTGKYYCGWLPKDAVECT